MNLKTAVDADLQVEMPLKTDRSVVPAEAVTHAKSLFQIDKWLPAFAGTTPRREFPAFQLIRRFLHTLEGGVPCPLNVLAPHNFAMDFRLCGSGAAAGGLRLERSQLPG